MPWSLEGSAAVVVARRFNVTAANQHWLVKHGILGEEEPLEGSLFSDAVVQVRTGRFLILLLPDQLQFVPDVSAEESQAIVVDKLGGIVRQLPHVPYKALGLNFIWHLIPADGDTSRVTRELFYVPDRPLFREFSSGDARFGGYLSKDFDGFRLKLDVKPFALQVETVEQHRVQFIFNFHRDLQEDTGAGDILTHLPRWNELRAESQRIIEALNIEKP